MKINKSNSEHDSVVENEQQLKSIFIKSDCIESLKKILASTNTEFYDTLQREQEAKHELSKLRMLMNMMAIDVTSSSPEIDLNKSISSESISEINSLTEKLLRVLTNWNEDQPAMEALEALEKFGDNNQEIIETDCDVNDIVQSLPPDDISSVCYHDKNPSSSELSVHDGLVQVCQNLMKEREDLLAEIIKMRESYTKINSASNIAAVARSKKELALVKLEVNNLKRALQMSQSDSMMKRKITFLSFSSILMEKALKHAKMRAFMKWRLFITSSQSEP